MLKTQGKSRPFPWRCPACLKDEVCPVRIPYDVAVKHDGVVHTVSLPAFEVPQCGACGELLFGDGADDQISQALRVQLKLLSPEQIRASRDQAAISEQQLADDLGITLEVIQGCENGSHIQSKTLDNLMRVYFAVPGVRAFLRIQPQMNWQSTHAG